MGTITNDDRFNERADDWDDENWHRLYFHAMKCGLTGDEAHAWAEAQNPYRQKSSIPSEPEPMLFVGGVPNPE